MPDQKPSSTQWPETAEAKAAAVVIAWRRAHGLRYLSPIALRDLAQRIARQIEADQ
jgi:hypothetical protein